MTQTIIRLMEEAQIILGTASADRSVVLADREAVNVLPYRFVVPFVRVKSVTSIDAAGVTISFRHAALLSYPEEPNRFVDIPAPTSSVAFTASSAASYAATPLCQRDVRHRPFEN